MLSKKYLGENARLLGRYGTVMLGLLIVGGAVKSYPHIQAKYAAYQQRLAKERAHQERLANARSLCSHWADKLDQADDWKELWSSSGEQLRDPWGHSLFVVHSTGTVTETIAVRSPGPDGVQNNDDDIAEQRTSVSASAAAGAVADKMKEKAAESGQSMKEKVKGWFK